MSGAGRLALPSQRRHLCHGLADRDIGAAGDRAEHGGAEQHGLLRLRQRDGEPGRIGHDLPHQRTAAGAAAHDHDAGMDAMRGKGIDHLGEAIGEPAEPGDEQPLQARDVAVEIEAGDHRTRLGIGIGRAIAEEFGQHMDVAREQRGLARPTPKRVDDAALENSSSRCPRLRAPPRRLGIGRMRRTRWSIAAPAADCPPSFSHRPGTMPEK